MTGLSLQSGTPVVVEREHLQQLFNALGSRGYQIVGPTIRDGAITYDELASVADLPAGWMDEQDGGTYRLKKRADQALFGYVVGPHSWKKFLFPPALKLFAAKRTEQGFEIVTEERRAESGEQRAVALSAKLFALSPHSATRTPSPESRNPKLAFIGVRSCELHAIAIQDRIFMGGQYVDPSYKARRENVFIVAVNCGQAGGTCFCVSMNTGPKAAFGFDLALTEVLEADRHYFVVEAGTELGVEILREVPHKEGREEERAAAERIVAKTIGEMGRTLDTTDIKDLLYRNYEHPRWSDVARRCLTCGNCTMVCPTCFCTTVEDVTDLTGERAERWRKWDSCFTTEFSYIFGGSVRPSAMARYRQWMTHKLATWIDQFGTSGCVGCGRCITWCPIAIDITEEVRAIRETEAIGKPTMSVKEKNNGNA